MRVIHVIPSMDPSYGGPATCLRDMIPAWSAEGDLHEVVCLDDACSSFLGIDPFPIHAIGRRLGPLGYHPNLVPWLINNLHSYQAVVVHGLWQWHTTAVRRTCRSLAQGVSQTQVSLSQSPTPKTPPYFVMPHGNLDPWFQRDPTRRFKALRNWFYWKIVEHRVVRDAEALLFTCEEEKVLAREPFRPYAPKTEVVVGLGVSLPPQATPEMRLAFQASCPQLPLSRPYLLFLSRIHPKKGVDLMIKAYMEIFGGNSGSRLPITVTGPPSLVIAGPLDSEYAQSMIRLAKSLLPDAVFAPPPDPAPSSKLSTPINDGCRPSIHFTGMLQGDAKWGALYSCAAFILPSHQENFGIAVVEALACGKPVLISDKVNIWREINSSNGGLVERDSPEGTISLIRSFQEGKHSFDPVGCYRRHFEVGAPARRFQEALHRIRP